jgi:ferric-dicitrate binding protein FerR (iron transport regulator)
VFLLFSFALLLVAAAAAAGQLRRGVHHRRGRAGCASGYKEGTRGARGARGERRMSVSRDSCGWIAKLRGGVRDSRCRAHLSAWRALRQSALRRVFAATGVVSSTGLESRPGVDCRGPGTTRERTARRECGRARGASAAGRATGARFASPSGGASISKHRRYQSPADVASAGGDTQQRLLNSELSRSGWQQ